MFDSVLQTQAQGQQRALGGGVSVLLHALVIGAVVYISSRPKPVVELPKAVPVAFVARAPTALPPPPPPPPPAAHKSNPTHPHKVTPVIKPVELVVPKEIPKEKPPEKTPEPPTPDPEPEAPTTNDNGGVEGGKEGGVPGGVVGGVKGGVIGGVVGNPLPGGDDAVFFGEGMIAPVRNKDESPEFKYTPEALAAHVEGVILVKCGVSTEGKLRDCQIIKRLPHFEDSYILEWLSQQKMTPTMQGGRAIAIKSYTIPIRLKMP